MARDGTAGLKILHIHDIPPVEVRAQMHGDRRVGAHLRVLEQTPHRTFIHCHYDPGMTIEEHGHSSDHAIYVLGGSVMVGSEDCCSGTLVLLEEGATFGPLVAGPDGTDILELYAGDLTPVPADPDAFHRMLADRGIEEVQPSFSGAVAPGTPPQ